MMNFNQDSGVLNNTETVQQVLDNKIRPQLHSHQGDLELISVQDGVVTIKLLGACSGCPAADDTRKDLIESVLKEELIWVESVNLSKSIHPDLLNIARQILSKKHE